MNSYSVLLMHPNGRLVETQFLANEYYRSGQNEYQFLDEAKRIIRILSNVFDVKIDYDVEVTNSETDQPFICEDGVLCNCEDCQPNVAPSRPPNPNVVTFNGLELTLNEEETERLRLFLKYLI